MKADHSDRQKFALRLPPDLKAWIAKQAEKHGNSQNAEIIRAVRERFERVEAGRPTP